jgi:hypothetical protein
LVGNYYHQQKAANKKAARMRAASIESTVI